MDQDQHCLLPEHGLFISPQGRVTACCVSVDDSWQDLRRDPDIVIDHPGRQQFLADFDQGKGPKSCDQCRYREHYSLRREKSQIIDLQKSRKPRSVIYSDVTWANTCALSCVMCGPTWSHTWCDISGEPQMKWQMTRDQVRNLARTVATSEVIEIKGGDPFNLPYFTDFIDTLVAQGSQSRVQCLSHCQTVTERQLQSLAQIPKLSLGMSVEATGLLYQWIRGGARTLDMAWQNLLKMGDRGLIGRDFYFSSTLTVFNISLWHEQHDELADRFRRDFGFDANWSLNLVIDPPAQSCWLARPELRLEWLEGLAQRGRLRVEDYQHLAQDRTWPVSKEDVLRVIAQCDQRRGITLASTGVSILEVLA